MPKKIYLDTKELYKEIIVSKAQGRLTPRAGEYFYLLVKNISKKFRYSDEEDRWDCESEAMIQLLKNWNSFNEEKSGNAFAYYTEICKRGFAHGFNQLHKKDWKTGKRIEEIAMSRLFEEGKINI